MHQTILLCVPNAVNDDTYVDVITGKDDLCEAVQLAKDLQDTLKKGGFNLGSWSPNSSDVLASLPPDMYSQKQVCLDTAANIQQGHLERALGVAWNPDLLTYRGKQVEGPATKQVLLSTVMAVFGPFEFLASWLLPPKMLM